MSDMVVFWHQVRCVQRSTVFWHACKSVYVCVCVVSLILLMFAASLWCISLDCGVVYIYVLKSGSCMKVRCFM